MKKNNYLRIPFVWADRRPVLLDRLLYIPGFYENHHEWERIDWSDKRLFNQSNPVMIEYCSGNGEWICDRAEQNPELNWVAVEKRFDRSRKIWSRMHRKNLSNLYIICGEAKIATQYYLPKKSISKVFINFPDPWPKPRHAKNRLITADFLQAMKEVTQDKCQATFVTDDPVYLNQILDEIKLSESWTHLLESPHYTLNFPNYGKSFFGDLWTQKGRVIHYISTQKNNS
jgi:tRNA (guanine-N7-)-methyltransferase